MPTWGPTAIGLTISGELSEASNTDVATEAQTMSEAQKRALARTAIEDASQFYSTGKLLGVLPAALEHIRELAPELRPLNDSAVIDFIVEAAEEVLRTANN